MNGLLNGNSKQGMQRVPDTDTRAKLEKVNALFLTVSVHVSSILQRSPEMFMVTEAINEVAGAFDALVERIGDLEKAHLATVSSRSGVVTGGVFGAAARLCLAACCAPLRR